jgi:hypothetical protein
MFISTCSEFNRRQPRWGFLLLLWVIGLGIVTAYNARVYYLNEERPWPWDIEGWIGWRRWFAGRCIKCGYDLTGNKSGRCPECGEVTDRDIKD